jgi:hypothetical protein
MNDTSPEVEARLDALFARRSGSDRLRMTSEMFALARTLMVANIRAEHPDISDAELRVKIFERTYGDDFDPGARARITARLRGSS